MVTRMAGTTNADHSCCKKTKKGKTLRSYAAGMTNQIERKRK
jgi:hypothetical protein